MNLLYKVEKIINIFEYMKKNSEENIQSIQVDAITGEYYTIIPEWIMNELSWYEDTEVKFSLDGEEIVITEYGTD